MYACSITNKYTGFKGFTDINKTSLYSIKLNIDLCVLGLKCMNYSVIKYFHTRFILSHVKAIISQ